VIHRLKIDKNYLDNLLSGKKKAEVRLNDRDYQRGDSLLFEEYKVVGVTTEHLFEITHIHSGLGLEKNYVVLSVVNMEDLVNKNRQLSEQK